MFAFTYSPTTFWRRDCLSLPCPTERLPLYIKHHTYPSCRCTWGLMWIPFCMQSSGFNQWLKERMFVYVCVDMELALLFLTMLYLLRGRWKCYPWPETECACQCRVSLILRNMTTMGHREHNRILRIYDQHALCQLELSLSAQCDMSVVRAGRDGEVGELVTLICLPFYLSCGSSTSKRRYCANLTVPTSLYLTSF